MLYTQMKRITSRGTLFIVIFSSFWIISCGLKGPPLPPEDDVPTATPVPAVAAQATPTPQPVTTRPATKQKARKKQSKSQ